MQKQDRRVGFPRRKDLTGQTFGSLTVREYAGRNKHRQAVWSCVCKCGKAVRAATNPLTMGVTKSCGCLSRETSVRKGLSHTPIYAVWRGMLLRCEDPSDLAYARYGGRGITVCERWHDFAAFLADMGQPPEGRSIERIDNDGNYEPSNCRWATRKEQARNRRTSLMLEFLGETKPLAEWCELLDLNYLATWKKLRRRGMSVAAAFQRVN